MDANAMDIKYIEEMLETSSNIGKRMSNHAILRVRELYPRLSLVLAHHLSRPTSSRRTFISNVSEVEEPSSERVFTGNKDPQGE